jgi:hypothetical protein
VDFGFLVVGLTFALLSPIMTFTFGCLGLRWSNKDLLTLKIDYTLWEYLSI